VLGVEVNCQSQCSPGIGSNNETEFTAATVTTPSIFLNTDYPATCSGTLERWRLCFYLPDTHEDGDRYRLTLAVYRPMGSGNSTQYERVESSLLTITARIFPTQSSDFSCRDIDLDTDEQFNIETGDIVGVCVFNPTQDAREPMDIVSEANGYSLMQNSVSLPCRYNTIPSVISSSQLSRVESRLLHLSAGTFPDESDDCMNVVRSDFC
jgi:hypothetical protein